MIEVWYSKEFVRKYSKLEPHIKKEVKRRIEDFKDRRNHGRLEVHKLTGRMKGKSSFSVDYHNRIVFQYDTSNKNIAYLLDVGDHSIYQ